MADSVIHIDMTNALMSLPVASLIRLTNIALNTMDMMTLAGVAFTAGVDLNLELEDRKHG